MNCTEEQISMQADLPGQGMSSPGQQDAQENSRDVYFTEAGQLIIDKDRASIGMLQRMFKIGFNRAARIMDQLGRSRSGRSRRGDKAEKSAYVKRRICRNICRISDFM